MWTVGDLIHYVIDVALIFAVILLTFPGNRCTFAERFPQVHEIVLRAAK